LQVKGGMEADADVVPIFLAHALMLEHQLNLLWNCVVCR
jgi:hypothetical protein